MTGQKQRIIKRFEKISREQLKEKKLNQNYLDVMMFSLKDIKKIINDKGYDCGHDGKPIILDDNELSITAFFEWNGSVGREGDRSQCWVCYCNESNKRNKK